MEQVEGLLFYLIDAADKSDFVALEHGDGLDLEYRRGGVHALMLLMEDALGGEALALRNETYRRAKLYADALDDHSEVVRRFHEECPLVPPENVVEFRRPS